MIWQAPTHFLLTLFGPANSDVLHLIIAGISRKYIFITQEEEIQDISEK
jgi:hypothetical protein